MKAIRMMTKDANMDDKKSTENPQADNTQSSLPAPNPFQTVNNVTEETKTEQKVWGQPSGTVFTEPPPEQKPDPNTSKSQKKEQTSVKAEEPKEVVQKDNSEEINAKDGSQQSGRRNFKRKIKGKKRRGKK